mgnify:CR=1 FL=1
MRHSTPKPAEVIEGKRTVRRKANSVTTKKITTEKSAILEEIKELKPRIEKIIEVF